MNKFIILFLLSSYSCFGQLEDSTTPEEPFICVFSNTICLDNDIPFFGIPENSFDFEFMMFNRWGELLVETHDPNFELGRILSKDQIYRFRYMEVFPYVVRYKTPDGEEHRHQGHLNYIEYCNCG